jgi:diacylglycerol kinase family enzyme
MYAYFIDDWVYEKHHHKIDRLDLWLTQAGISGRKIKLARLNDLPWSIKDCVAVGVKIFIAVGDDATASRVLNNVLNLQKQEGFKFTFGFIPISESSAIAPMLGMSYSQKAVNALASNQIISVDLGMLNNRHYFITAAVFPKKCALGFRSYTVSSMYRDHHISVCNTDIYNQQAGDDLKKFNPSDGILEAVIAYHPNASLIDKMLRRNNSDQYIPESIFPVKKITIKSKQKTISVIADIEKQLTSPIEVEVVPGAVSIIHAT